MKTTRNRDSRKPRVRQKLSGASLTNRSRITNGSTLLEDVDGRSAWARRFRDLVQAYLSDLGGDHDGLSEGQRAICRRVALIQTELEFQETRLAKMHAADKMPDAAEIESYGRIAAQLRRLVESLDLHKGRVARDVTPPTLAEYAYANDLDAQ